MPETPNRLGDPETIQQVLDSESQILKQRREKLFGRPPSDQELKESLFGICFSGGGIRSATFNLGILQGLAGHGILKLADYLSTVSGGGYIGSWFHGLVQREPYKALTDADGKTYTDYEDYLAREDSAPGEPSRDPISFLRKYSNYLSPELGLLSSDTWVIATIWLRNTALNQMILFFAIAAVLTSALVIGNFINLIDAASHTKSIGILLVAVLFWVVYRIDQNLDRIVKREFDLPSKGEAPDDDQTTWYTIVVPLWVASVILTYLLASPPPESQGSTTASITVLVLAVLFIISLNYSGFWICYRRGHQKQHYWQLSRLGLAGAIVVTCSVVSFALLALERILLFYLLRVGYGMWHTSPGTQPTEVGKWLCITVAPFLTILVLAVGVVLQQGLAGVDFPDSAREWYSRLAAKLLIVALGWVSWFVIAAFAPIGVVWLFHHGKPSLTAASVAWIATTAAGVISGKSPSTAGKSSTELAGDKRTSTTLELLARYAPPIALAGILIVIATVSLLFLNAFFTRYPDLVENSGAAIRSSSLSLNSTGIWLLLAIVVVLAVAALLLSARININEFSLNHFYKNRLVRCYLGASQGEARRPNRFTGFDPKDDVQLSGLLPEKGYLGPFAILNCALNLNHGKELAWQERKATSFVFTPKFCGYLPSRDPRGFVDTVNFVGPDGPHIGMATAISGAAVNPNWGYHTQPTTAFLLTLFNVRLGWWVGNTRIPKAAATPGPQIALRYLVSELLGFTDEDSKYANLSDGGHFENLGLYELTRRKCRFIIVGDGEQDETYQFESLGAAIRKIRIDFGHSIEISPKRIFLDNGLSQVHCALGKINYNDGSTGILLHLKSSLTGDETYDVTQHKKADPNFPHDTTLNQFFTESMFESYRVLGKHVVEKVFNRIPKPQSPIDLASTFKQLQQNWLPPVTAEPGSFTKLTKVYSLLLRRLSEDDSLRFLDSELFEKFPPCLRPGGESPELRRAKLLILDFIQLMEDVYTDLDLEDDTQFAHSDYSGWIKLFAHWAKGPTFGEAWETARETYGLAFQQFYQRVKDSD